MIAPNRKRGETAHATQVNTSQMAIETKSMRVTPVCGNVFAELGFEPEEAAVLKAESQRIISETLAIKELGDSQVTALITDQSSLIK